MPFGAPAFVNIKQIAGGITDMQVEIRQETIRDYNAIAEVNLMAFRTDDTAFVKEAVMVDTLRHRPEFDQDLALVAEVEGKVVGYALFSPCTVYFKGKATAAVILAPLAVHPAYQKQGIGGRLLEEGHRRAAAKGYKLCLLYGEKDYYPRFGYRPSMFSGRGLRININDIPASEPTLSERPLEPQHIPTLVAMWKAWHQAEPIAMFPGASLVDWSSHYHNICTSTILIGEQVVGYLRYLTDRPGSVLSFLANNREVATAMLSYLRTKFSGSGVSTVSLPLNPFSEYVAEHIGCTYASEVRMSIYAMIKVLDESEQTVADYCRYVTSSQDSVGVLSLPAQFEWC